MPKTDELLEYVSSLYIPVVSWSSSMLMDYYIPVISLQICNGDRLKAGSESHEKCVISQGISKTTRQGETLLISSSGCV